MDELQLACGLETTAVLHASCTSVGSRVDQELTGEAHSKVAQLQHAMQGGQHAMRPCVAAALQAGWRQQASHAAALQATRSSSPCLLELARDAALMHRVCCSRRLVAAQDLDSNCKEGANSRRE